MSEWLPMEGAPKDGTVIQARFRDWAPFHMFWRGGSWQPIEFRFHPAPTHFRHVRTDHTKWPIPS